MLTADSSTSKSLFFKILAASLAVFLTLLGAEAVLQIVNFPKKTWSPWVADPHTGFRFGPNLDQQMITEEYNVPIATNEDGLRDDPVQTKKKFRILMLGDSFTFGYGVPRPDIFADRVEKELGVEVINAGMGGYDLINYVQFLKYYGRKYEPDLIVCMLYLGNDLTENAQWDRTGENLKRIGRPSVRSHVDIKLISLLKILRHNLRYANHHRREWALPSHYLEMTAKQLGPDAVKRYAYAEFLFGELAKESSAMNVPFAAVTIPYKTMVEGDSQKRVAAKIKDFWEDYDLSQPEREVRGWAEKRKVPALDLTEILKNRYEGNHRPLYFYKDGHLNPEGHQAVAEALIFFLKPRMKK